MNFSLSRDTARWQMNEFHPVIRLPQNYEIFDFTSGYDPDRVRMGSFGIGRYAEKRKGMYTGSQFISPEGDAAKHRDIHMGVDIAAPVATEVHAFSDGEVFDFAYHSAAYDYGYTLITRHLLHSREIYALHGHLNAASIAGLQRGQHISRGQVIAWIGDRHENGGWNPHLHFQLSWQQPKNCDMPGAVSDEQLAEALTLYPDPRLVLGPLY